MPDYLGLYHRLPYFLKVAAASARGYQLRRWRYGRDTQKLITEALERDTWTRAEWQKWREEKLEYLLDRAANQVPYYQNYWQQQKKSRNRASWLYLENWPILEKETLRLQPKAFLAGDCNPDRMYMDHTGGTTGTPINIYESQRTLHKWYAIFEARVRGWHRVSKDEVWGIFGGQLVIPTNRKKPPYWVFNYGLNQLYLSTFHISSNTAKDYVQGLCRYAPTHLIVYPSSASYLAHLIIDQNLTPPRSIRKIFSNAELLLPEQRETLEKAFHCPVVNTYGMGELVAAGSECQHKSLHIWPDIGIIECYDEEYGFFSEPQDSRVGEYIVTGLLNTDMPLIRYRLGDRGDLPDNLKCLCGRGLPVIDNLQGRTNDMILTPDGRKLFWFNSVFYEKPIIESQIVQEKIDKTVIYIVPGKGFSPVTKTEILDAMRSRVGDQMDLEIVTTDFIPRTKAGKLQAIISQIETNR